MLWILNGMKTGQILSVLWSKMSSIQMVRLIMWSDHLKTGQKSVRKVKCSNLTCSVFRLLLYWTTGKVISATVYLADNTHSLESGLGSLFLVGRRMSLLLLHLGLLFLSLDLGLDFLVTTSHVSTFWGKKCWQNLSICYATNFGEAGSRLDIRPRGEY